MYGNSLLPELFDRRLDTELGCGTDSPVCLFSDEEQLLVLTEMVTGEALKVYILGTGTKETLTLK